MLQKINWFVFLLFPLFLNAQSSIDTCSFITFQKMLVNEHSNLTIRANTDALQTADSNFIIVSRAYNNFLPDSFFIDSNYITKLNSQGDVVWSKAISNSFNFISDIIELPGHEYLAAQTNASADSIFLTRFSAGGNIIWSRYYNNVTFAPGNIICTQGILYTTDNNILVNCLGDDGLTTLKLDMAGTMIWAKNYRPDNLISYGIANAYNYGNATLELTNGYLISSPFIPASSNDLESPVYLIKIDKLTGNLMFTRTINI